MVAKLETKRDCKQSSTCGNIELEKGNKKSRFCGSFFIPFFNLIRKE